MSDPQNFGLDELGQRLQAMGLPPKPPAAEPRLRPYQGAPLPIGNATNGNLTNGNAAATPANAHAFPPYETPHDTPYENLEAFENLHTSANSAHSSAAPTQSSFTAGTGIGTAPATPYNSALSNGSAWINHPLAESGADESPTTPATPKTLSTAVEDPNAKSGFQRAIDAVRSALPVVQKLLPLLDGNFANLLSTLAGQPSHPPQVKVDLEPVERGISDLRTSHRELRTQVQEQTTTLKRVEDQLERVREATDRNTLEQQELVEDLRSVGNRISTFAVVGLLLLAISLGLNIYFLVQLQHILR